ncbi:hypothetical protein EJ994_06495 [Maribacter sp. MJ134]|uniref:hypothetical protein n=1 Tax=Maribacter sp. MJ134 TaxID=2496865 RepID=UPI000F84D9CA|nr:hypothetical protein [Maribacter sp. MJ134]AZQ58471.1 hypothetical protein EJ994_06495 [Maribacter sp. MJ134]
MTIKKISPIYFLTFLCVLILSCSKDSDLLTDYVITDDVNTLELRKYVVDDMYFTDSYDSIILDVLSNDNFYNGGNIRLVDVSQPSNGSVTINEDNTLTYTPYIETVEEEQSTTNEEETNTNSNDNTEEDTFVYVAEVIEEDNTVTKEEATVTISSSTIAMGELKAFPGAEGFGKNATGGRGGIVVEVTNLNDSGSGSLRNALKRTERRTIIFKVSGTINCKSYLDIPPNSGNVTIAGQTAPGEGIIVKGAELRISASNVIIRHIAIRPGSNVSGSNINGIRLTPYTQSIENLIFDHVSVTWTMDKNFIIGSIADNIFVNNVTVQNSIIAENIGTGKGFLIFKNSKNISVYKNLFAHLTERNIRSSTCSSNFEMINNVVYGFKYGTQPTYENEFDIIGNVYKTSPATSTSFETIRLEASTNNCPNGNISRTKGFISDNTLNGGSVSISSSLNSYLENSRRFNSGINPISSNEVESTILSNVGNSLRNDPVDIRIIDEVSTKSGSMKTATWAESNYPDISNKTAYKDSDKDGISDEFESQYSNLNPKDGSDGSKDDSGNGYTNLEEFLHYLTIKK